MTHPVDAYWKSARIVMEFSEPQHSIAVPHFDELDTPTVSWVPRGGPGGQRHLYDLRRHELIPTHGLRLVRIYAADFRPRHSGIVQRSETDVRIVRRALDGARHVQLPNES